MYRGGWLGDTNDQFGDELVRKCVLFVITITWAERNGKKCAWCAFSLLGILR